MNRTARSLLRIALPALFVLRTPTAAAAIADCGLRHVERFIEGAAPVACIQVWDITADGGDGCRVFFATNDGLCVYDGVRWETYQTQGSSVIRALRYDFGSKRLYTAGVNEFGYWRRNEYGGLSYTALYRNPDFRSQSNDFWRIATESRSGGGKVYFQCREKICIYDPLSESIRELTPQQKFRYMYEVDGQIYVQDGPSLSRLHGDDERKTVCEIPDRIINLLSGRHGELLAAVEHIGLLIVGDDGTVSPLDEATNRQLSDAKITCCRRYDDDRLLVGTTRCGLFLIHNDGTVDHSIPYGDQLNDTTILSVASDERGNIWLGLDSGVATIDNSSQDYYLRDSRLGSVLSLLQLGEEGLLAGSNKGLFRIGAHGEIDLVPGSTGSVWGLEEIDGRIYVLHDQGLFRLTESMKLEPIMTGSGVYSMRQCRANRQYYILSTYSGLALVRHTDTELQFLTRIADYNGFTRNFRIDDDDRIWVTVAGVGFVRLTLSGDKRRVTDVRSYDLAESGDRVLLTRINQELLLCCGNRAWRIDGAADSLVRAPNAEAILRECGPGVKSIVQQDNRFWFVTSGGMGYVERTGTTFSRSTNLLEHAVGDRTTGFRIMNGTGVIGFRNGLGFSNGPGAPQEPVEIGMVAAQSTHATRYHRLADAVFEIPASMNTLRIWPLHLAAGRRLEYRIASLSPEWQTARIDEFLQVPALPHGRHVIELRLPQAADPSAVRRLEVSVRPPWYISWPMILMYILTVAALLAGVRSYYLYKSRLAQAELHRREEERRIQELEQLERENLLKEKRIAELEREQLKNNLRNKDKRLANITMNSIRRNNMLNELKSEVAQLTTAEDAARVKSMANRIIRQINVQLKDDSDWHLSESYFNTIYDGLLDRLRARYPSLSQTDMRLCVYIKLNLTTKETAELMNISPRSVEMARYRLRKKLGLGPNEHIGSVLQ